MAMKSHPSMPYMIGKRLHFTFELFKTIYSDRNKGRETTFAVKPATLTSTKYHSSSPLRETTFPVNKHTYNNGVQHTGPVRPLGERPKVHLDKSKDTASSGQEIDGVREWDPTPLIQALYKVTLFVVFITNTFNRSIIHHVWNKRTIGLQTWKANWITCHWEQRLQ
jgi:hypothetical protein